MKQHEMKGEERREREGRGWAVGKGGEKRREGVGKGKEGRRGERRREGRRGKGRRGEKRGSREGKGGEERRVVGLAGRGGEKQRKTETEKIHAFIGTEQGEMSNLFGPNCTILHPIFCGRMNPLRLKHKRPKFTVCYLTVPEQSGFRTS